MHWRSSVLRRSPAAALFRNIGSYNLGAIPVFPSAPNWQRFPNRLRTLGPRCAQIQQGGLCSRFPSSATMA
jgi:hypothetical protein